MSPKQRRWEPIALCLLPNLGAALENIFPPLTAVLSRIKHLDQALEQMGERSRGRNSILRYTFFPIVKHFEILCPSEEHQSKQKGRGWSLKNLEGELLLTGGLRSSSFDVVPGAHGPPSDPFWLAGAGSHRRTGCWLKNPSEVNPSTTTGERTLSEENGANKAAGCHVGQQWSGRYHPAALQDTSAHSCHEGRGARIKTHRFPLDFHNFSKPCVRAG